MSMISVTLMLLILASIWSQNTVSSARLPVGPPQVRSLLHRCRCQVLVGKEICRKPGLPKTQKKREDVRKCLCSETLPYGSVFKKTCRVVSKRPLTPAIPLL